jgi:hypothetical protein
MNRKTISINEARQRRKGLDKPAQAVNTGSPLPSPFSYIILLDENDQSAETSPTTDNRKKNRRHPSD